MSSSTGADDGERLELPKESLPPARLGRAVQISLIILAVIALLFVLREARLFLMPTVLGALIALAATPLCALIERTGLPASIAALLVTFSLVLGAGTLGWYMIPSLDQWRYRAPEVAMTLERKLRRIDAQVKEVTETAAKVAPDMDVTEDAEKEGVQDGPAASAESGDEAKPEEEKGATEQIVEGGRRMFVNFVAAAPEILGATIYCIFLIYFLMAERSRVRRWTMMMATSRRQAARIGRTLLETRDTVGLYMGTVALINICLGIATAACFWLIEMPAPLLWGAFMTLMNFMPYIGPLIVQACALAVGFVTYDTTAESFYPLGILLALNMLEGQLLTPTILGRRLSASPLAVFLAVAFGAWMWGAIGAVVATPALIVGSNFVTLWVRESRRQERLARYATRLNQPAEDIVADTQPAE